MYYILDGVLKFTLNGRDKYIGVPRFVPLTGVDRVLKVIHPTDTMCLIEMLLQH